MQKVDPGTYLLFINKTEQWPTGPFKSVSVLMREELESWAPAFCSAILNPNWCTYTHCTLLFVIIT